MKKPETFFDDSEHEYQVAGWLGTIAVMAIMASRPEPRREIKGYDLHLLNFCRDIAEGEDIKRRVSSWVDNKAENEDRIGALVDTRIMGGNSLDIFFTDAYDIYANEDWREYMLKETSFGRLYPTVQELADFYAPRDIPIGLSHNIVARQRDIAFYAGLYDDGF